MQSVDGDVRLSVTLDTKSVKNNVSDLGKAVKVTLNQANNAKGFDALSTKAKQLQLNVEKASQKVSDLRKKLAEAESTQVPTEEFTELGKDIEWTKKKLDELNAAKNELNAKTTIAGSAIQELAEIEAEIDTLTTELNSLRQTRQELVDSGKAGIPDSANIENLTTQLHTAESELEIAQGKLQDFNSTQQSVGSDNTFKDKFSRVASIVKTAMSKAGKYLKSFASVAKSAFSKVANLAKSAFSKITSHARNSSKSSTNAISNINGAFRKGIKTILRYGLGIRGTFMLFRKLRSAVKEGLQNLAQYSDEVNTDISGLMSAFTKLKNSLATMFQPLVKVVAPILTSLINKASQVATSIGKVIAAFTGQNYVYEAVDIQEDYAKSLDKTSKSAKNAKKALKEYTSPLDDINKFQEASTETSDEDNGSVDPSKMFKLSAVESKFKDLASKLKDSLKSSDWTSIGEMLGKKLNSILDKIDWAGIKKKAEEFATRLYTLINGFVNATDWTKVGSAISNGIQTVLISISTFLEGLNFSNIGKALGQVFNEIATPENAMLLAKSLSNLFSGALKFLISLISTINWGQVSDTIIAFISNFDFSKISQLAVNLLSSIATALRTIKFDEIGKAFSDGLSKIDFGGFWDGIVGGIGSVLSGAGQLFGLDFDTSNLENSLKNLKKPVGELLSSFKELSKKVLPPIINKLLPSLVSLFGGLIKGISPIISSLSPVINTLSDAISRIARALTPVLPVLGEVIGNLITMLTPILGSWINIIANLVEDLAPALTGIFAILSKIFEQLSPWIEQAVEIIQPVFDIIGGFIEILGGVIEFISGIFTDDWEMAWDGIKHIFSGVWDGLVGTVAGAWERIKLIFSIAWIFIKNVWDGTVDFFSGIWDGITQVFANVGGWFSDIFSDAADGIKLAWEDVTGFFSGIWDGICRVFGGVAQWFSDVFTSAVDFIKLAWEGVTDFFQKLWEGIWNVIKTPINWIIDGINYIIDGLNLLAVDIPDWVPLVGGQHWGFDIDHIPYLATGAVIPPNREFLAVLGDQKQGTNIETPENLLRSIIREELGNNQTSGNVYEVPLIVGRKTLAKLIIDEAKLMMAQTGKNPFELITV